MLARFNYRIVHEELPASLFEAFSRDPAKYCEALQGAIMLSRLEQWHAMAGSQNIAFDRSVDEDVTIFCRMHHERGLLTDEAFARLRARAIALQASMPVPDLIVFMSPGLDMLRTRVTRGGHPQAIIDSLDRQVVLYKEWLSARHEDVLKIDNSAFSLKSMYRLFEVKT
jgi:deoxyadenosine/deoxycytidine kinase